MKNLHILPTDKPSRLWITWEKQLGLHPTITNSLLDKQHIYITSNEEIKKGDWVLSENKLYQIKESAKDFLNHVQGISKKIILTTDQDLIKDGVQAIGDNFLEWFVKNLCEEIDIDKTERCTNCGQEYCDNLQCRGFKDIPYYKIIIPKEEPKQETLEEAAKKYYENNIDNSNIPREHYEREIQDLMIGFASHWQTEQYRNK